MNNKISIVGGKLAGNTFHGTKEQVMLAKHGWKCAERKKNGCVWHVRWYDPIDGEVWNQGTATTIQRERNKAKKLLKSTMKAESQIKEQEICQLLTKNNT